ncbi:EcKinase 2 [Frankliniella occidentalis]|uniref:Uncharacterized protein LOC127752327 n=1 Tax=Frankliniella occidentalis TaxID=133901 RepID=A0A9C6XBL8_FRAOC|nr:uncharacterized protein LOC127752327 [Frankliniella occidentalis]KAE8751674.1 EcKinase 2 [Frankliniella occidentalis]
MTSTMEPTDTIPTEHLQRILQEVTEKKGIKEPRYTVSVGSKPGDNYLGLLYRVEVREGEAAEPTLRLIAKLMPRSERRRRETRMVVFFDNECNVYHTVLPGLNRFVGEVRGADVDARDSSFPYTAPLHHAHQGGVEGEDTIVLEDMRPLGFTLQDRKAGLDEHHVRAVLRALAHLHAASIAMQDQRPDEFAKLRGHVRETLFCASNPCASYLEEMVQRTYGYIKERFPEGSAGYIKMKSLLEGYIGVMAELTAESKDGGNAILHGDTWTNNVLFKHSEAGSVEEVCLLDFQLARFGPPVLDIAYLVYCCTVREFRDKHLDKLLGEYHDQLSANLRRLGSDPDKVYSRETMQAQLRERMRFGLGMAVMTVPLFLADPDEIPDMDEQFEKGADMKEMLKVETKSAPERNKRISDVLEEMMERGWI